MYYVLYKGGSMEKRITNYKRVLCIKHVQKNIEKLRLNLLQLSDKIQKIDNIFSSLFDDRVEDFIISEFNKLNLHLERFNHKIDKQLDFLKNPILDIYRDRLLADLQFQINEELKKAIHIIYGLINYNNKKIRYYEEQKKEE
jgi:hypothetical protein